MNPLPVALDSLKDPLCLSTFRELCAAHDVQLVLNTTAFAALGQGAQNNDGEPSPWPATPPCCR
jgi:cobaltochelatase CobN